jgi:RimJ/RimL family protein N-acetyltransferase
VALNDADVRHWMHGVPETYTEADALRDLSTPPEKGEVSDPYWVWALVDVDDQLVGKVALSDPEGSMVNLSYWLHPEGRGRGWMTTAARTVTSWAFGSPSPGFTTVRADVARDNRASRSVLERAGFVVAEKHTKYRMGDGSYVAGLRYVRSVLTPR